MTALELANQRGKLLNDIQALNTKAETENRDLNTEEKVTYERMKSELVALTGRKARQEEQEQFTRELAANRGSVVDPTQQRTTDNNDGNPFATKEYRSAVETYIRKGHGYDHLRDISVSGTSGVTLPTDVAAKFVLALNRGAVVRKAGASVLATNVNTTFPISSVVSGGWEAEAAPFDTADPTITDFAAKAFKYTATTKISQEFLNDSYIDIQSYVTERFADSIAQATDDAYINGNGTTQPKGVFGDAVAFNTTNSSTSFTQEELLAFYFSLPQQYRRQPDVAFIMNDSTIGAVASLVATSNVLGALMLFQLGGPGEPDKILGKPVYSSSAVASTFAASAEIAVVGSWKYYQIVDRLQQINLMRANELFIATGQVGFYQWFRTDGKATVGNAFRKLVLKA